MKKTLTLFLLALLVVSLFSQNIASSNVVMHNNIKDLNNSEDILPASFFDEEYELFLGDLNNDYKVTVQDAIIVLRYITGLEQLTPEQLEIADVTGKGKVTVSDAILILRYVVNLIYWFPRDNDEVEPVYNEITKLMGNKYNVFKFESRVAFSEYLFRTETGDSLVYDISHNYLSRIRFDNVCIGPDKPDDDIISYENAYENALSIIKQYYPNKDINILEGGLKDWGMVQFYQFTWRDEVEGLKGPNIISVTINAYNGNIFSYSSRYMEVTAPTIPEITEEEAIEIAIKALEEYWPGIIILDLWFIILDIGVHPQTGKDYLRWTVAHHCNFDGILINLVGEIDAITGELVS